MLCCMLCLSQPAAAAALGEATVHSSLGQSLDTDIAIVSLSATEANSLIVRLAPAAAFTEAGIDYTPLLRSVRVSLERRGERQVVRLTSDLPVSDPFIRLLVELTANDSRTIREYTLLIDPPAIDTPGKEGVPSATRPAAADGLAVPANAAAAPAADRAAARPPAGPSPVSTRTVQRGETLRSIGMVIQPQGVRLEQVLVALQQANPDAFVDRNVNRLRSGSVLRLPDADAIRAIDPEQARQIIRSQASEFLRYQQTLAQRVVAAPATTEPSPAPAGNRSSSGQVGVQTETPQAPAAAQDKLTLSAPGSAEQRGTQSRPTDTPDKIANDNALADANSRIAALEKNISQLQQMLEIRDRAMAEAQQRAVQAPQSGTSPSQSSNAQPSASQMPAKVPPVRKSLSTPERISAVPDQLIVLSVAAAVLLLSLLVWAVVRWRDRRVLPVDEPMEPVLAPTVIDDVGGRHVDTRHSEFHSNFVPSVSQIDANEVDAVAEADIYIAYGRDEQAEEILLDALRTHPQRHALRVKLLEIYSARKDMQRFGAVAAELRVLTHGIGADWERAAQLGRQFDPGNRLFDVPAAPAAVPPSPVEDFDMRLERLLDEHRHDQSAPAVPSMHEPPPSGSIDFELSGLDAGPTAGAPANEAALTTKLELAQACSEIGDHDGARELLDEVAGSGHPDLAARAQSMLRQLA